MGLIDYTDSVVISIVDTDAAVQSITGSNLTQNIYLCDPQIFI